MTDEEQTELKTLWSETILEILYAALQKDKSDAQIIDALKDIQKKGYKPDYIINKVEKKVDKQASIRVKNLLKKR